MHSLVFWLVFLCGINYYVISSIIHYEHITDILHLSCHCLVQT